MDIPDNILNPALYKKAKDLAEGPAKVALFGLEKPEDFLHFSQEAFDCVNWNISHTTDGFDAVTHRCVICQMAKEAKAPSPCAMHCINPFLSVIKGMSPTATLDVLETLQEGEKCHFRVIK